MFLQKKFSKTLRFPETLCTISLYYGMPGPRTKILPSLQKLVMSGLPKCVHEYVFKDNLCKCVTGTGALWGLNKCQWFCRHWESPISVPRIVFHLKSIFGKWVMIFYAWNWILFSQSFQTVRIIALLEAVNSTLPETNYFYNKILIIILFKFLSVKSNNLSEQSWNLIIFSNTTN